MKRSTGRILTTHVGSLARPASLDELVRAADKGKAVDEEALRTATRAAVGEIVRQQVEAGLTVVNDGEQGRPSYKGYVRARLNGFGREQLVRRGRQAREEEEFPEYFERSQFDSHAHTPVVYCEDALSWRDFGAVERDIENLRAAVQGQAAEDVFMTSASPGVIADSSPNRYYPDEERYLYALAEVMRREYRAIVDAGFTLQLDCPELAMSRHRAGSDLTLAEFRKLVEMHVEVLNHALDGLPPDQLRLHMCWGRSERPHNTDVPLADIVDLLLRARPAGLLITAANGRHEHEWRVWQEVDLPEDKVLIPGVIDNTTNIVEHPEVVAERIVRYANVVGRERMIAGVDCGFGNSPTGGDVDPRVAWAKLRSLAEGADLATRQLWR